MFIEQCQIDFKIYLLIILRVFRLDLAASAEELQSYWDDAILHLQKLNCLASFFALKS